jgi:CubicO group peptidase (beta-lactamase class C family)
MKRRVLLTCLASLLAAPLARAADLPAAAPEEVGLSPPRLDRMSQFFAADTASKHLPGAVVMIARNGKVAYQKAFGVRDAAGEAPMALDSIFRIYSMTKPITGVAVLMLMEEGRFRLADPVSLYLPALKNMRVQTEKVDASGRRAAATVPADREITIQDLLRHTSGITYGAGNSAAERLYVENGIGLTLGGKGNPMASSMTDQQVVEKIAQLPLMFQPGTSWEYGRSIDVLGALVEKVSGMRLDRFFEERIFKPLGMNDTAFNLPPGKYDRVAQPAPDPDTGRTAELTDITAPRTFMGGGEGLLSTAADYMRFCQMLLDGGELNGVRLLSRKTVELMTSDHLDPALARGPNFAPGPGYGFGLTVAVRNALGMSAIPGSVGEYNWGGAAGTAFWIDPRERLIAIMMIQSPGQRLFYRYAFRDLVYQSFGD